jgi:glycosyltransferase involved in cell wall biosynthesis
VDEIIIVDDGSTDGTFEAGSKCVNEKVKLFRQLGPFRQVWSLPMMA